MVVVNHLPPLDLWQKVCYLLGQQRRDAAVARHACFLGEFHGSRAFYGRLNPAWCRPLRMNCTASAAMIIPSKRVSTPTPVLPRTCMTYCAPRMQSHVTNSATPYE